MSDKAKPLTPEERVIHEKHFQVYEACGSTKPVPKAYHIRVMRCYEATVRHAEKCVGAALEERDRLAGKVTRYESMALESDAALCKAEAELDQQKLLVEALMSDPNETDRWDLSGRLHDAWKEIRFHDADLAAVTRERDVWKAERKEAVEAGQAMVARVKKERDALRQERDELLDELEGAYEALRYDAEVTP